MARFVFVVCSIIVFCGFVQAVPTVKAGRDSVSTDMYGTFFLFPRLICPYNIFYKAQVLPRGHDPVVVIVKHRARPAAADGDEEEEEENTFMAELRNGNGSTIFMPCHYSATSITSEMRLEVVSVEATREILLHVMHRNDSISVIPVNALGTDYTLLSMPVDEYTASLIIVTPTANCTITITDPSGRTENVQKNLSENESYRYMSEADLTGWRVTSDQPVLVVSGKYREDKPQEVLLEHVRPDDTWGSLYLIPLPFDGKNITVHLSAYAPGDVESLTVSLGRTEFSVQTNGQVLELKDMRDMESGVVRVSSTGRPFQLLFLLSSPLRIRSAYLGNSHYGHRLNSLASVAPVEQYLSDPCLYMHRNTKFTKTVVVGVDKVEDSIDALEPLSKGGKLHVGEYWVRTFKNSIRSLGIQLHDTAGADQYRMWFHDVAVMRRFYSLFYLDGGSYLSRRPPPPCNRNSTTNSTDDDRVDNDCDGFIDEELPNGKDDDGDGEKDEDTSVQSLRDCQKDLTPYFWEPNRYRNTRFESRYYEFARRLPTGSNHMVVISASVGVAMVFTFFVIIWIIDMVEQYRDPGSLHIC